MGEFGDCELKIYDGIVILHAAFEDVQGEDRAPGRYCSVEREVTTNAEVMAAERDERSLRRGHDGAGNE